VTFNQEQTNARGRKVEDLSMAVGADVARRATGERNEGGGASLDIELENNGAIRNCSR